MGRHIIQKWYEFTIGYRENDRYGWDWQLVIENDDRYGWDYRLVIENDSRYGWDCRLVIENDDRYARGGVLGKILMEVCRWDSEALNLYQTTFMSFLQPYSRLDAKNPYPIPD